MKAQNPEAQAEVNQLIEELKREVKALQSELGDKIYAVCELLDYQGASQFSYNVDRLNQFVSGINQD